MLKRSWLPEWTNNKLAILLIGLLLPPAGGIAWLVWRVARLDDETLARIPSAELYARIGKHVEEDDRVHAAENARNDVQDEAIRNLRTGQTRIEEALREQGREFAALNRELRRGRTISAGQTPGPRIGLAGIAATVPRN